MTVPVVGTADRSLSAPAALPASLADAPLFGLPLADLWFALVFALLGAFLFLDGFDFGIGALFALRDDDEERERLLAAIGPFWDGNEVWLVVFGGSLFAAFPAVYAALFSRHYLLLFAILGALIVRGLAPEMYEQRHDERWHRLWGRAFVVGSVTAPFLLGAFVGNWLVGASGLASLPGVLLGLAVVALTVADGAAFLGLKTEGGLSAADARRGVRAAVAHLALAVAALGAASAGSAEFLATLRSPVPVGLLAVSVALTGGYAVALRRRRYAAALAAAAGLAFGLVALAAALMYPLADPAAGLSVADAAVPTLMLNLMSVAAALLLPLVVGYFAVLYSAFRGPVEAGEAY